MKPDKVAQIEQQFEEYLSSEGLRNTFERKSILRCILSHNCTFTPSDVIQWVKDCHISTATVYNTLNLLVLARILQRLRQQTNSMLMRYELMHGHSNRMQIVCTRCGRMAPVRDNMVDVALKRKKYRNFLPDCYSVFIYGVCEKCENENG